MASALRAPLWVPVLLIAAVGLCGCSSTGDGDNGAGQGANATDDGGGADDTDRMRMNFPLDPALGSFQLEPGVPQTNRFSFDIMVPFGPYETIGVDLADTFEHVGVMPADEGNGKATVHLQSTDTAVITWWVGPLGDEETVCETGGEIRSIHGDLGCGRTPGVRRYGVGGTHTAVEGLVQCGAIQHVHPNGGHARGYHEHRKSSHGPDTRKTLNSGSLKSIFVPRDARGDVAPLSGAVAPLSGVLA